MYVLNPLLIFGGLGVALVGAVGFVVFSYGKTSKGGV
jgi:preprotein translocase subunit Sss1